MLHHVSFDFDGVLAQGSNDAYFACYHQALLKVGVELDQTTERQRILERWGRSVNEQVELLLQDHPGKIPEALVYFKEAIKSPAFRAQVCLFKGADEVIRTLNKNYTLSIVSGAKRELIASVLGPELTGLFQSIHCGPEYPLAQQKPSPYMLEQAMQQANAKPQTTLYIGDAPNDIRMAIAAGVTPIAILTGFLNNLQAKELGARHAINDISELPNVLAT